MASRFPFPRLGTCVFIDSGVGGLPYLQQLKRLSAGTPCVYIADNKNFPYGEKTAAEISEATSELAGKAISRFHPAVIVIACNTMSVSVLQRLRETFPLVPFVGTVPAIKKAAAVSKNRIIGLLATSKTVKSPYTASLIAEFASDCKVISLEAPKLISEIEQELIFADDAAKLEAAKPFAKAFMDNGADTVVLGCTHFLHLRDAFREALGGGIQVVDSLGGVAQQALRLMQEGMEEACAAAPEGGAPRRKKARFCPFDSESLERAPGDYFFVTKWPVEKPSKVLGLCQDVYGLKPGGIV